LAPRGRKRREGGVQGFGGRRPFPVDEGKGVSMKSMKRLAALLCAAAFALPGGAMAQDYYTLPEIREQAAQGWHETYTDKYGRTRQVDVDIEVFGEENAPVVKACWSDPQRCEFVGPEGDTRDPIIEARVKGKGVSIEPYELVRGMRLDLNREYAAEYGNDMTMGEVYDFFDGLLKEQGIDQEYVRERPYRFSILYSARKDTGEILIPALYSVELWQKVFGLPILTNVAWSYRWHVNGPVITPSLFFDMRSPTAYLGATTLFDVDEVLAEDIPLCSVDKVIEGARGLIEDGYVHEVLSLRFGYVVYGDPDEAWGTQKSGYDMNTWYLVPSWVMECYTLEDPEVDKLPEYPSIWEITINAQTGEMADYLDTSFLGRGDPRYKGFIPWDDVK